MAPSVKQVLGSKRTLLLNKIAASLDWPDRELHSDLSQGFRLTGYLSPAGVSSRTRSRLTVPSKIGTARSSCAAFYGNKVEGQVEPEYSQALWDLTLEEANTLGKGWLEGPLNKEQLDAMFPDGWCPCRRFAVWQGKWRPIDDFSDCGNQRMLQLL